MRKKDSKNDPRNPTVEQWQKYFRIKAIEQFEQTVGEHGITITSELVPFCRALFQEGFMRGMDFSAGNVVSLADKSYEKLLVKVFACQSRTEKYSILQTELVQ